VENPAIEKSKANRNTTELSMQAAVAPEKIEGRSDSYMRTPVW
jgi:hypothetical protein